MRLVSASTVKPGAIIAKAIYNEKGQILLNEDVLLTEGIINRLKESGINNLLIKDKQTEGIQFTGTIPDSLRREAIQSINMTFSELQNNKTMNSSFVIEKASKRFSEIVRVLITEINEKEDLMSLLSEAFSYDNYIFTHSLNVTLYSLAIGIQLKLSQKELEVLGMGAIFHDIGKLKVPLDVLLKPGKLTEAEYLSIKKHTEDGFNILRKTQTIPLLVSHCAFQHHERLNGSGYPRGIKGEEIHFFAKIIAVADVFDAVTSNRVYRNAMLPHEGLEILYAGSESLFERTIVDAFRRSVAIYPVGISVRLNDGRKGIVSRQNIGLGDRPIVRILEQNNVNVNPYELDLKQEMNVVITECDTSF